jgi:DNA-binding response OmpR family regulator
MVGKVVAIDDDHVNLAILQEMFPEEGYCLYLADNAEQGLTLCEQEQPDVVLLDIMMPGKNGYEVCQMLRETMDSSQLRIIMLTGKILTSDRIDAYKVGADDYMTKPFSGLELKIKVDYYLSKKCG